MFTAIGIRWSPFADYTADGLSELMDSVTEGAEKGIRRILDPS